MAHELVEQAETDTEQHVWQPSQLHRMTTRLGRKVSTFNAILHTTELLENILSHLEPEDLQAARRVCTSWAATIEASPLLQRRAYIRAESSNMTWVLDPDTNALCPYWFDSGNKVDSDWFERQGACVPAVLNGTFLSRDPDCVAGKVPLRQRFERAEGLRFHPDIKSFFAPESAKDTYLTQPPAKEVIMYIAHRHSQPRKNWTPKPEQEARIKCVVESGVKWSDLLKSLHKGVRRQLRGKPTKSPKIWVDIELSRVWIIGSVFYNEEEYQKVMTGQEAVVNPSPGQPVHAASWTSISMPTTAHSFKGRA